MQMKVEEIPSWHSKDYTWVHAVVLETEEQALNRQTIRALMYNQINFQDMLTW